MRTLLTCFGIGLWLMVSSLPAYATLHRFDGREGQVALQHLLATIAPHDTVLVQGGRFTQSLQLHQPVHLIGEQGAHFDAQGKPISLVIT
ncbi:hypothetical protein RZS08_53090, partial [Arthrospira platensis SPKY1]|nr:hypothetical protein [Arthrospira platensis SPKY1]